MSDAQVTEPAKNGLFDGYKPTGPFYDEVFTASGQVRQQWRDLLAVLDPIGRTELTRRWTQAQEEMHATGTAYNAYDELSEPTRPWSLDLVPQLIPQNEWATLAAGLKQRAALLNQVVADLYGPQELLTQGLLPADWLFSNPAFRRNFHGQQPKSGTFIHFYAADLARAPDGTWWVLADRTDAPLGIGYALENRIVTSRMLSSEIHHLNVERLAPFFVTLRATLRDLAPAHRENPHIVLLSQGPSSPNYFEDAYLSRYLGFTLVEGGDLAVRDDQVFMKTLAGLLPVDVIMRRMSDAYCDPLELQSDATLGVPGLLEVARLGRVALANALGSSLVESPSLMPFLIGIAEQRLGEELILPSVATWWCGQHYARSQVVKGIEQGQLDWSSIGPAYRVGHKEAILPAELTNGAAGSLMPLLSSRPRDLIAQETVQQSTTPVWHDGSTVPWHVAMRVFLVSTNGDYSVMPGGLVRLAKNEGKFDPSILGGQISRDAWVRSNEPVQPVSLLRTAQQPVKLRRGGADLPSRVADSLFWFGRQIERAQGTCRLLRQVVARLTGEGESVGASELLCLVRCLAVRGQIEPGFAVEGMSERLPAIAHVLPSEVLNELQQGSLRSSIVSAHRNASLVRDRLSLDSWRVVSHLEREVSRASERAEAAHDAAVQSGFLPARFGLVELDELLDELIVHLAALDGLIGESMTRAPAWQFLDLGRRLERSMFIVALVQSFPVVAPEEEGRCLEAILEVADSIMTYRSRYLAAASRAAALDLLVTDETNPRSLAYQLAAIANHVAQLPRGEIQPLLSPEERLATLLLGGVRMLDTSDLSGSTSEHSKLEQQLALVAEQLPKLSELISNRYLVHAGQA